MNAFIIFDDFPIALIDKLKSEGINTTILQSSQPRPSGNELKQIIDKYDIIFISTAQVISEAMLSDIESNKIIVSVSNGTDHIHIPSNKEKNIYIANAPLANCSSVAEHTFALILAIQKRLIEGRQVAAEGKTKKMISQKPVDLKGSTIGVIGAGAIASLILRMAKAWGMNTICWTFHPLQHKELEISGTQFTELDYLLENSNIISVNIPYSAKTENLINREKIALIKPNATFINTSRAGITDNIALIEKASQCPSFGLGLDIDSSIVDGLWSLDQPNIIITPHIAGGTIESRFRLFEECVNNTLAVIKSHMGIWE